MATNLQFAGRSLLIGLRPLMPGRSDDGSSLSDSSTPNTSSRALVSWFRNLMAQVVDTVLYGIH